MDDTKQVYDYESMHSYTDDTLSYGVHFAVLVMSTNVLHSIICILARLSRSSDNYAYSHNRILAWYNILALLTQSQQ